ncbi:MAG TPA: YbhB/YbcL family Raf kinase inhibitor-like protein [Propionibacteriaceae bacterium]|nr:YbhB/YbcL family Raf kinase inhibitor-like protein [Propionibacteriaceae bacterium]
MELTSTAIPDGSTIDLTYAEQGAGGANVSPDLTWSGAPEGTQSYAVTIYDPDAPTGSGWWHWIVIDIPASVTHIEAGQVPEGAREWVNDYGYVGYGGACPPPGPAHHYVHTVHALPFERHPADESASSAAVRAGIFRNQLASASFTALFAQ